jgi:hypothetical protein
VFCRKRRSNDVLGREGDAGPVQSGGSVTYDNFIMMVMVMMMMMRRMRMRMTQNSSNNSPKKLQPLEINIRPSRGQDLFLATFLVHLTT